MKLDTMNPVPAGTAERVLKVIQPMPAKVVSTSMCLVTFGDVLSVYCRTTQAQAAACEHVTIVYIRHGACRTEQNCGCKQCGNSVQRDSKTKLPVVAISRELCKVVCTRKPIVLQHSLQNLN